MNHRVGQIVFALAVGLLVAFLSYRWITNPEGRQERSRQEVVVEVARQHLRAATDISPFEIVDPLAPNRKAGKVYIYPEGDGWSVSGYYRRNEDDRWHAFLMTMDPDLKLVSLKIQDSDQALRRQAATNPKLEISP